jgi:hypothetical protein
LKRGSFDFDGRKAAAHALQQRTFTLDSPLARE